MVSDIQGASKGGKSGDWEIRMSPEVPYVELSITVKNQSNSVVAVTKTDRDGRFRIPLKPGRYVLEFRQPDKKLRVGSAMSVNVSESTVHRMTLDIEDGKFTELNLKWRELHV